MANCKIDLVKFYQLLDLLSDKLGAARKLKDCNGHIEWPSQGVYFFFEPGEFRSDTGDGMRVVRVGTHAVSRGAKSKLWGRLAQHGGTKEWGGGNHRGSIFRKLVGAAMITRSNEIGLNSWGIGGSRKACADKLGISEDKIKELEKSLEIKVSSYIGEMPFLWLNVPCESHKNCDRAVIEQGSIALLSNYYRSAPLDPPSRNWLGYCSGHEDVRKSGLWNSKHVKDSYSPAFLNMLEHYINAI